MPSRAYEAREIAGIKGWQLDPEDVKTVTVVPGHAGIHLDKLHTGFFIVVECDLFDPIPGVKLHVTNHIKPSLRLIKKSSDGSPLGGVHFRIAKIEDGTRYLDRITNDQGEILISDLGKSRLRT